MVASETTLSRTLSNLSFAHVALALAVLTAIRIAGLHASSVDLYMDEAQYWAWSRELAFGYFSKPPLLAWIIAGTDPFCGSGEACVRVASPLMHFGTALIVYVIAEELYDGRTAAWSAFAYSLAPGVIFSSRIISTDVPLLLFWTVALLAYIKLLRGPDWRWSLTLGVTLGLGMLAKYAMIYFLLCAACAAFVDRDARTLLRRPQTWVALGIAGIFLVPNVLWNAENSFVTLRHTGDNITGGGLSLRFLGPFEFVGSQFAVIGPIIFAAFLCIVARIGSRTIGRENRLMLAFALPPLALLTVLALWRTIHANWAAPAALSMTILVVAWWRTHGWRYVLGATLWLGLCLQATALVADANAYRISIPALGRQADVYRRTLGWHAFGDRALAFARADGAKTVVVEGRAEAASLVYSLRNEPLPVLSWPEGEIPNSQFDLTRALDTASAREPVLVVTACPFTSRFAVFYQQVKPLGLFDVATGPTTKRQYSAFVLGGRKRGIAPIGPCVDVAPR
jgi:4-amino-4-deoxy-L-arabinose transferase-like glycosyltransferase